MTFSWVVYVMPLFLLFQREIVLHGLDAVYFPGGPGRMGTGADIRNLAGQRDDPRGTMAVQSVIRKRVFMISSSGMHAHTHVDL